MTLEQLVKNYFENIKVSIARKKMFVAINCSQYAKGNYICTLFNKGKAISSVKFIKK